MKPTANMMMNCQVQKRDKQRYTTADSGSKVLSASKLYIENALGCYVRITTSRMRFFTN